MMYQFIKRHKLSVLTILGLSTIIGGYFVLAQKPKTNQIKINAIHKGKIIETVSASGTVDAAEKAILKFQTSGRLAWVGVQEGEHVNQGQALAALDKRELQKNLHKKLNNYLKERWDFEQAREDYAVQDESDFNYPDVLTDAIRRILQKNQFDLNNSVLDVEIENLALRFATLTTPISGIVTKIATPYAGVNITPATAKFTVVNPASVEFVAEVDEVDIAKIKTGQQVRISLDAYPGQKFITTVKQIQFDSTATKGGGTAYLVKMKLPANTNERFKLGMNGDAEFVLAEKQDVLILPQKAITSKDGKTAVWIIGTDNKVRLQTVSLGAETPTKAEIRTGLKAGDKIIVEGFTKLAEGEKINAR